MNKFLLLFIGLVLISCFKEPKKETNFSIDKPTVIPTPLITEEKNSPPYQDDVVDNINVEHSIVLFDNVNRIYPGESTFNDVKFILGSPDYIDVTKAISVDGETYSGNKIVKYEKLGITLVFPSLNENVGVIDAINVSEGFKGVSVEGIYIGMQKEDCLTILNKKYHYIRESDNNYFYSIDESERNKSQFIFKNNKLSLIRINK